MRKVYNQKNMSLTIDGVNIQDFHEGATFVYTWDGGEVTRRRHRRRRDQHRHQSGGDLAVYAPGDEPVHQVSVRPAFAAGERRRGRDRGGPHGRGHPADHD